MNRALWLILLSLIDGAAFAQNVEIDRQELDLDLTGPASTTRIEIRATLRAVGPATGFDAPAFLLPIESITVDNATVAYGPHAQYPEYIVHLDYPRALEENDTVELRVVLRGEPRCESVTTRGALYCVRTAAETVLPPAIAGQAWYLINLYAYDGFAGTMRITAPAAQHAVAGEGLPVNIAEDAAGGRKTWTYDYLQPTESLAVYSGSPESVSSSQGFSVTGYFPPGPEHREKMTRAVDLAAQIIPEYGEMFGAPMPVDQARIVTIPGRFEFAGIGLVGMVIWADYILGDYDYLLEQGVAHELAHTWWGHLASGYQPHEAGFFNEAFAEYSAWRAMGAIKGDAARTSGARMNALWYMYRRPSGRDIAVLDENVRSSPAFVHVTYHKGSTVLRTLEERAGEEAFSRALSRLVARGYGMLDTDALIADIRAESGVDVAADVDRWLFGTGYPHLRVSGSRDTLTIELSEDFQLQVPVRLTFSDGTTRTELVSIARGSNEVSLQLDAAPVLVELDPRWTIVREVKSAIEGDVTLDGVVDGLDLLEVSLRLGGAMATERRKDGAYDPIYDVDHDLDIDESDVGRVLAAADPE